MDHFDWQYYLDKYPDLRANGIHTEQQAIEHWNNFGKNEDRIYCRTKCGFAISTYHRNNSRMEALSCEQQIKGWGRNKK